LSSLEDKSIHELRAIYAAYGHFDGSTLDKNALIQKIEMHQQSLIPEPELVIPAPAYDARLMSKPPAKRSDRELIEEYLAPYVAMGMHLEFPHEEQWYIRHGKREDSGSVRQKPLAIMRCADRLMKK
jgi:hypothetical protein